MSEQNDTDRYVVPTKELGGWDVVKEDHERASARTRTRFEAVDRARDIVDNLGGASSHRGWARAVRRLRYAEGAAASRVARPRHEVGGHE